MSGKNRAITIIERIIYNWNQGTPAHNSSVVMPQKEAMYNLASKHRGCFLKQDPYGIKMLHIMGNISHLEKEMVRLLWQRLPDHVFTECLLDGEVTDGGRSVTGYSKLRSTNVFRRSQSSCSASAFSFKFNNNSFMQSMRQSGATIVGWGLKVPYVHRPGSTNIAQLIIMYTWSDHTGNLANCLIPFIHLWIPSLSLADIYIICDISLLISSTWKMGHDKLLFSISVFSTCTD